MQPTISDTKVQEIYGEESALLEEHIQPEWVSYSDAERYSGLSHVTLWRRVSSGELNAARVGRSVPIHLPTLREFMERASEEAIGQ